MARIFSTQIPLNPDANLDEFLNLGKEWIAGSPHSIFRLEELKELKDNKSSMEKNGNSVNIAKAECTDYKVAGIEYSHPGIREDQYHSRVIGVKRENKFMTSITVDYDSSVANPNTPIAKRPYILGMFLRGIGSGRDGDLIVKDTPTYLTGADGEEVFVGEILKGQTDSIMPVVYMSRDNNNLVRLNPEGLARDLQGIAHVFVEPSKEFSFKMREQLDGNNVFGGAIGTYWCTGEGKYFWLSEALAKFGDKANLEIYSKIVNALCTRRIPREMTWENINSLNKLTEIERLKSTHTQDVSELCTLYEEELATAKSQVSEYETRVEDLTRQLRIAKLSQSSGHGVIRAPQINPFYEGELEGVIHSAFEAGLRNINQDTRRADILREVIKANPVNEDNRKEMEAQIKKLFNNYTHMTPPIRKELQRMGFEITDDGPHYKLFIANSPGRTVIISRTPSDQRTGKNTITKIIRAFF